jgi:hypothetical protein
MVSMKIFPGSGGRGLSGGKSLFWGAFIIAQCPCPIKNYGFKPLIRGDVCPFLLPLSFARVLAHEEFVAGRHFFCRVLFSGRRCIVGSGDRCWVSFPV